MKIGLDGLWMSITHPAASFAMGIIGNFHLFAKKIYSKDFEDLQSHIFEISENVEF